MGEGCEVNLRIFIWELDIETDWIWEINPDLALFWSICALYALLLFILVIVPIHRSTRAW